MSRGRSGKWYQQHVRDPYVRKAQKEQFRSRAAYKLEAIDKKDGLIKPNMVVVDLGAAPGAWSQYARQRVGSSGAVIAIDRLPMKALEGVEFIQGDLTDNACLQAVQNKIQSVRPDALANLVISDIAPNITGIKNRDAAAFEEIWQAIVPLVRAVLCPGGSFLAKVFTGLGDNTLRQMLGSEGQIIVRKPGASRSQSREYYVLWHRNS